MKIIAAMFFLYGPIAIVLWSRINAVNETGTPLQHTATKDITELLLSHGAKVNAADSTGLAIGFGQSDMLRFSIYKFL
jgi:hypothetical protein